MKKYFAKYLPVDETPLHGDMFFNNNGVVEKAEVPEKYINPHVEYFDGYQKAVLFLCSRDIQVGDKYRTYLVSGEFEDRVCSSRKDGNLYYENKYPSTDPINLSFKIIGEISPEATWVKEGDEFDEEEIGYKTHHHGNDVIISIDQKWSWEDWNPKGETFVILGPCKHFH